MKAMNPRSGIGSVGVYTDAILRHKVNSLLPVIMFTIRM